MKQDYRVMGLFWFSPVCCFRRADRVRAPQLLRKKATRSRSSIS